MNKYAALKDDGTLGFKKGLIGLWGVCALFIVYLGLKPVAPDTGPYGDEMIHITSCAILMLLPTCVSRRLSHVIIAGGLLALAGVGVEIYQAFLPGRESSIMDELCDLTGITLGISIGYLLRRGYSIK